MYLQFNTYDMQSVVPNQGLRRLDGSGKCEAMGCHEKALWAVFSAGKSNQWCGKHTRTNMMKTKNWGEQGEAAIAA